MKLHAVAGLVAAGILSFTAVAQAGTVTLEPQGGRPVRVFMPSKPASPLAMVVMLHGCTQTADAFADATRMDEVAEESGFVVAYPEQGSDVIATRCWQWYEPAHQARDAGEPKELADAAAAIAAAHGVDKERVYVAGISAGGAMSVVLGATYPDRFAAVGVVAGLEYKAGTSFVSGATAAQSGGPDPLAQGDLVHTQMGTRARVVPAIVFHGTADAVVAKVNGDQVATQWRQVASKILGDAAIDAPATTPGTTGYPFTWTVHRNKATGASIVEHYVVSDLGHAWPGGKPGGSYADAKGPDASHLLWSFFRGRTIAAPLAVPPPVAPPGAGTDATGGTGGTSSGGSGDPGASSGAPGASGNGDGGGSGDSGGCAVARRSLGSATSSANTHGCASALGLALAVLSVLRVASRMARPQNPGKPRVLRGP